MQNQYTRQAERAIKYAARMARKLKHPYIGTEHLLLGLRSEITGVAGQVLASHGVDEEQLLHLMDELIVPGEEILQQDDPKESPRLEYILENAKKAGRTMGGLGNRGGFTTKPDHRGSPGSNPDGNHKRFVSSPN